MTVEAKPAIDIDRAKEVVERFQRESTTWLYGVDDAARILSWAFFTLLPYTDKLTHGKALRQPHVMFRGPTGTGKTDLVSACAMAIDAKFERIQGLPTYMPEDILGYETIIEDVDGTRKIHFKPGKLMAHIVLIDEDNRLSGKTKAAILEGMEESSATLASDYGNLAEGKVLPLFPLSGDFNDIDGPRFFMIICTENIFGEEEGTFPTQLRSSTVRRSRSTCWTQRMRPTSTTSARTTSSGRKSRNSRTCTRCSTSRSISLTT